MTFKQRIEDGLAGQYKGLNNGLNRINKYIFGVQRSCYTLLGGLSGSAKTMLIDFIIINALQDAEEQEIPINIFYYSYEIDETTKRAQWLSMLIYNNYQRIISPEKIKGLGDFRLSIEEKSLVDAEMANLDALFHKINWIWESTNPTGMYKSWWTHMNDRGTFEMEDYIDEHKQPKQRIVKFIPTDSSEYNIVILDHIALCKLESREGKMFTLKENLDKLSEYCVRCRNLFKMTFFVLQQFNQGLNSVERSKFKGVDISPQQSDFKDSTNCYTDCDVALGLMNAYKMDMETSLGYFIDQEGAGYNLMDRYRMLKIIKNRLSRDNISLGLLFLPESCYFEELPPATMITQADMNRYNNLVQNR